MSLYSRAAVEAHHRNARAAVVDEPSPKDNDNDKKPNLNFFTSRVAPTALSMFIGFWLGFEANGHFVGHDILYPFVTPLSIGGAIGGGIFYNLAVFPLVNGPHKR